VETDIHYPTDSSLLGDGVRVLTRTMQRMAKIAGRAGTKLRDRTRAVGYQVRQIGRASRSRIPQGQERLKACYRFVASRAQRSSPAPPTYPLPSYPAGRKAVINLPSSRAGDVSAETSQGHFCAGK
jgi:hypothetical protein